MYTSKIKLWSRIRYRIKFVCLLEFNVVMVTEISKDVGQNDEKYMLSTDIQYIYYVRYLITFKKYNWGEPIVEKRQKSFKYFDLVIYFLFTQLPNTRNNYIYVKRQLKCQHNNSAINKLIQNNESFSWNTEVRKMFSGHVYRLLIMPHI